MSTSDHHRCEVQEVTISISHAKKLLKKYCKRSDRSGDEAKKHAMWICAAERGCTTYEDMRAFREGLQHVTAFREDEVVLLGHLKITHARCKGVLRPR